MSQLTIHPIKDSTQVLKELNIRLLEKSIKVWEAKRDAKDVFEIRIGSNACPLCEQYNHPTHPNPCYGCPVSKRVLAKFCEGTPFNKALDAFHYWKYLVENVDTSFMNIPLARAAWWRAANEEVLFLKEVLLRTEP